MKKLNTFCVITVPQHSILCLPAWFQIAHPKLICDRHGGQPVAPQGKGRIFRKWHPEGGPGSLGLCLRTTSYLSLLPSCHRCAAFPSAHLCATSLHHDKEPQNMSSENVGQHKPLFFLSWLSQLFCHRNGKLINTLCFANTMCLNLKLPIPGAVIHCFSTMVAHLDLAGNPFKKHSHLGFTLGHWERLSGSGLQTWELRQTCPKSWSKMYLLLVSFMLPLYYLAFKIICLDFCGSHFMCLLTILVTFLDLTPSHSPINFNMHGNDLRILRA